MLLSLTCGHVFMLDTLGWDRVKKLEFVHHTETLRELPT